MNTTVIEADGRRRRRRHSPEFKADAIAACRRPGVSIAAVAMSRGLNANLLRRWVAQSDCEGEADEAVASTTSARQVTQAADAAAAFVPLSLPPAAASTPDIRIELRRGNTAIIVMWPSGAAAECAHWLRALLK